MGPSDSGLRTRLRKGLRFLGNRLSSGLVRARRSIVPALQMTLAASEPMPSPNGSWAMRPPSSPRWPR